MRAAWKRHLPLEMLVAFEVPPAGLPELPPAPS
jgi:hypothetical protein